MSENIERIHPDLTGVSIFLCTPCSEGTFSRYYVRSRDGTADMVRAAGGKIEWADSPFCSDISLARNRLINKFARSDHTHMMMIDDDIGWNPEDILRLVDSGLDFVGGAAPRKAYPLTFCFDVSDEIGKPHTGEYNVASGALSVTNIGTGFLMIRKEVVTRMMGAHPELRYDPTDAPIEIALFDPLIENLRRYCDDYAFCHRWRKLGGSIYMMPIIRLSHTGPHTFMGCLLDQMREKEAELQKMAAE